VTGALVVLLASVAGDAALEREVESYVAQVRAAADAAPGWAFDVALGLWASGVEGELGARGATADFDVAFQEIFDELEGGLLLRAEARKGRWGFAGDVFWVDVQEEGAQSEILLGEVAVRYELLDRPLDRASMELGAYAGARWYSVDTEITTSQMHSWVDPIVGFDVAVREGPWVVGARVDIGGFGAGSDLSWGVLGSVRYRFTRKFSLAGGYRLLDVDYSAGSGANAYVFDARLDGPFVVLVFSF
jgi:hypothetical protein